MNHVAGLPRSLLAEDEGELIGIVVLSGQIGQAGNSQKENGN